MRVLIILLGIALLGGCRSAPRQWTPETCPWFLDGRFVSVGDTLVFVPDTTYYCKGRP